MMTSLVRFSHIALFAVLLAACGGGGGTTTLNNLSGVNSIEIDPASQSVAIGTSAQLSATAFSANSHADVSTDLTWSSSDAAVATVSSSGKISAIGAGTATISGICAVASVCGSASSTVTVTVTLARLLSIALTPPAPSIAPGTSQQFTATGTFSDNSTQNLNADVTWTSSNPAVATVSSSGLVSSVGNGSATITTTCKVASVCGSLAGTTTVTVTTATLVSIALTPPAPSLAPGTSQQFTATGSFSDNSTQNLTADLTWTSSNPAVATVNSSGLVSNVGNGTATITATCKVASVCGSLAGTTTVTVTTATLVSIALTPPAPSIAPGTSQQFTATGTYSDNSTQNLSADLTWTSSNPAVATVNSSGLVSTLGTGTATVTATCRVESVCGSLAGTTTVTVTSATLVSIAITPPAPSVAVGSNETFTATGTYSDASTRNLTTQVTWTSATPAVATISNAAGTAGVAHAVTAGTTQITAALGSVASPAVSLTVTAATLASIAVTPTGPSITVAASEQFIATGTYSDNSTQVLTTTVTWASSSPSIAAISNANNSKGFATGLQVGTSLISAGLGAITSPSVTLTVTAQVESVLWSFGGGNDGVHPFAVGLIQGTDGNFYGTTAQGGTNSDGIVFKITPAGVETVLYSFAGGSADGSGPQAGLVQGTDGNFYGTTGTGGLHSQGTVFKITPAGAETMLYSFAGSADGAAPQARLIQATDGEFYGTTQSGGAGFGTVFKITSLGTEAVVYAFAGGSDGADPQAALIQTTDGSFYGTTLGGGADGDGTVFKITAGAETVLHSFGSYGNDGEAPYGALVQGTDGNFYGTTVNGGTGSGGTVFKVTAAGIETVLWSFGYVAGDGGNPFASLVLGGDGNFYGTTYVGGAHLDGTIFKITPAGVETVQYSFAGGSDGNRPYGGLIQGTDGNFYGTSEFGGPNGGGFGAAIGDGTVFKY